MTLFKNSFLRGFCSAEQITADIQHAYQDKTEQSYKHWCFYHESLFEIKANLVFHLYLQSRLWPHPGVPHSVLASGIHSSQQRQQQVLQQDHLQQTRQRTFFHFYHFFTTTAAFSSFSVQVNVWMMVIKLAVSGASYWVPLSGPKCRGGDSGLRRRHEVRHHKGSAGRHHRHSPHLCWGRATL